MSIKDSVLFSGVNYVNSSVVTGSTTAQGFPISNAITDNLYEFVKFTANQNYIEYDLGSARSIQLLGILKHYFGLSATWRIRLGSTSADTVSSPLYDSGVIGIQVTTPSVLPWGEFDWGGIVAQEYVVSLQEYAGLLNFHAFHILESAVQARFVRIDFSDFEGVSQFARGWIGTIYQPSYNALYGSSVKPLDTTKERQHESGRRTYGTRRQRRVMELSFELPEAEIFSKIYGPLFSIAGKKGEIVCFLKPLNPETWIFESIYGNIIDVNSITKTFWLYGTTQIAIDERV